LAYDALLERGEVARLIEIILTRKCKDELFAQFSLFLDSMETFDEVDFAEEINKR